MFDAVLLIAADGEPALVPTGGWLLSLVGVTTLAAMATPGLSPGPVIGAGGYLGAMGRPAANAFASIGAYIITISLILGGLLLCTDYSCSAVGLDHRQATPQLGPRHAAGRHSLRRKAATGRRSDLDNFDDEIDAGPIAVRMSGRPVEKTARQMAKKSKSEPTKRRQHKHKENRPWRRRKAFGSRVGISQPKKPDNEKGTRRAGRIGRGNSGPSDYELPGLDLLLDSEPFCFDEQEKEVRRKAKILEKTFADFGFHIRVVEIQTGPVIAQFEVELEAGLRLSRITGLADDLAIALRVPSVRIVAPIPGKNTVGIEVPNNERQLVRLREVMEEANGKAAEDADPDLPGQGRGRQPDGRRPVDACRTC